MAASQNGSRTGGRPSWVARTAITIVSLGAFAIAVLMSIRMFGCVEGIEFSPDTFKSRTFVYYEVPLIRVRVTGVYRDDISGGLQRMVGGTNFTPASATDPPRWHLVAMTKGKSHYQDDALIVYRYLQNYNQLIVGSSTLTLGENSAAEFWTDWTRDHDKLAKVFWPAIAEVCRKELYTFTPALFAQAEQLTTAETEPSEVEFKRALAEVLADQYAELGDIRREQGLHSRRFLLEARATAALDHVPDYRDALSGREKSYYSAGESDKSKQDRDRLRALE